jgi:hypothetical protein
MFADIAYDRTRGIDRTLCIRPELGFQVLQVARDLKTTAEQRFRCMQLPSNRLLGMASKDYQ